MILVALGTQDKQFERLLIKIDELIDKKIINDEVVVQAGMTKYTSKNMRIFDFTSHDEFDKLLSDADLLITHGGVGTIIQALKKNKKVIAVPRLVKYKEHQSDHQIEIIKRFGDEGYIIGLNEVDELEEAYKKVTDFKPKKFKHNNNKMIKLITDYIKEGSRVLFISSTGGHLEELLELRSLFDKYKYHLITERTESNLKLKDKYKVSYLIYGTKVRPIIYIFKVLLNGFISLYQYIKLRPKYIVTTGTHTAIPMAIIGRIFGSKIIYIETFANSNTKTLTGNFLYKLHIYNLFIVQWKDMLKLYPNATYGGWIFKG